MVEIVRIARPEPCRQQLDNDTYVALVVEVVGEMAGADFRQEDTLLEAEERFRDKAELAGVLGHGQDNVSCCGGCSQRFRRTLESVLIAREVA